jgi:hypothetical protein
MSAVSLWALTAVFCAAALVVYQLPGTGATAVIVLAGLIWLGLIVGFLKIDSEDSISLKDKG